MCRRCVFDGCRNDTESTDAPARVLFSFLLLRQQLLYYYENPPRLSYPCLSLSPYPFKLFFLHQREGDWLFAKENPSKVFTMASVVLELSDGFISSFSDFLLSLCAVLDVIIRETGLLPFQFRPSAEKSE